MAIGATLLTASNNNVDQTSYTTASISPAANSLLLLFVVDSIAAGTAPMSVPTGLSLTWQRVETRTVTVTSIRRVTSYIAQCGGSPGSGAVTLTETDMGSGTTATGCLWSITEITGHDTTDPVRQVAAPPAWSTSNATSITVSFGSQPADTNSRPFVAFTAGGTQSMTPRAGWAELSDDTHVLPDRRLEVQWRSDAFEMTHSATFGAQNTPTAMGIEIAEASAPASITKATIVTRASTAGVLTSPVAVAMPSGVTAGDLLLALVSTDLANTATPGGGEGWTQIDTTVSGSAVRLTILAKVAAGGDALNLTLGAAVDSATHVMRIIDHGVSNVSTDIELGTAVATTSNTGILPIATPAADANNLWICVMASDDDDDQNTFAPTEYVGEVQFESSATTTSCLIQAAYRHVYSGWEHRPGSMTLAATEEIVAQTLVIPPSTIDPAPSTRILATHLTGAYNNVNQTSYTTASISPAANSLLLMAIGDNITGTNPPKGVPTGLSLTWTEVGTRLWDGNPGQGRLTLYSAQCGGSPGSGTVTITETNMGGGTTSTGTSWSITQVTGHHPTDPIRQPVLGPATVTSITTYGLYLPDAPADNNSRTFMWGLSNGSAYRHQALWTEFIDVGGLSPTNQLGAAWRSDIYAPLSIMDVPAAATDGLSFALEIAEASAPDPVIGASIRDRAKTVGILTSSVAVNMPPSAAVAGDLLIALISTDGDTSATAGGGEGWTNISTAATGTAVRLNVLAKIAAGGDTLNLTLGAAVDSVTAVMRIVDHGVTSVATDIVVGTPATGTSLAPDPPSVTPAANTRNMFIAVVASDDDDEVTDFEPVSYAKEEQWQSTAGATTCLLSTAYRYVTSGSAENPGAFTLQASEEWVAQTLVVPPLVLIVSGDFGYWSMIG